MADEDTKLTLKQEAFVCAYLQNGFNATKAAIKAGYSEDSARSKASQLLTNVNIAKAVSDRLDSEGITPEKIKVALAEIAFGADIADFEDVLTGEKPSVLRDKGLDTRLIKSVSYTKTGIKLEMYSRLDAIDKLAKVHGMFTENVNMSGAMNINGLAGLSPEDLELLKKEHEGPE